MKRAARKEKGFTLIELLVVIGIIGILAAIAIPQFASYRRKSFDAVARSDLKNAATAEEAYFADNGEYVACSSSEGCAAALPGFKNSSSMNNGTFTMELVQGENGNSFRGTAQHPNGSVLYTWDSAAGGFTN